MIPPWFAKLPTNLIWQKAAQAKLDPRILAAICQTESGGVVYAVRFEPHYRWLWHPPRYAKALRITEATEKNLQMQSYGLTQIMGANARWLGFKGALPALYKPETNLYWACQFLKYLRSKYDGNYERMVCAYNRGTAHPQKDKNGRYFNQPYVDKVFGYFREIEEC